MHKNNDKPGFFEKLVFFILIIFLFSFFYFLDLQLENYNQEYKNQIEQYNFEYYEKLKELCQKLDGKMFKNECYYNNEFTRNNEELEKYLFIKNN